VGSYPEFFTLCLEMGNHRILVRRVDGLWEAALPTSDRQTSMGCRQQEPHRLSQSRNSPE